MPAFKLNTTRQHDPTRTITLRNQFVADVNRRYADLKRAIVKYIVTDDMLAPQKEATTMPPNVITLAARRYVYERSAQKVETFMDWLREEERKGILEISHIPGGLRSNPAWTDVYVQSTYQKGIVQARADLRKAGVDIPSFQAQLGDTISATFNQPFHADRVALAYTRVFNGMEGITGAMNGQISRVLARGMAEGKGPYTIAKQINDRVDKVGIVRSRLIARTEMVQIHNEAALNSYEAAESIIGEPILVRWITALDNRVRNQHAAWEGEIFTRQEALTMLGEPNCRCGLEPVIESKEKEKAAKAPVVEQPVEEPVSFSKAKDLDELQTKFKDLNIGYPGFDKKYSGKAALALGNQVLEHFDDVFARLPGLRKIVDEKQKLFDMYFHKSKSFMADGGRVNGLYDKQRLKIEVAGSANKVNSLKVGKNSWTVGNDFYSVSRHEFGHHIHDYLGADRKGFSAIWGETLEGRGKNTFFKKNVSKYAESNINEAFAESFSAYTSPIYKKGMLPENIEKYFDELLK